MGWTFKLHGGVAAGLGTTLLLLATLTWLPGALPVTGLEWLAAAIVVLLFLTFFSALVRLILTGADKHAMWLAFRCLPGKVQMTLGALALWGVVVLIFSTATEGNRNLQSAEVRDGRYVAFDTTPQARGTVEISRTRYLDVLESDQRTMLAVPGVLMLGAAYAVLASGELRRTDGAAPTSRKSSSSP
ncbi:hypothetical protein JTP67_21730 [Streptomyces sp. S12]|nr:hypothetical protein [Streptomyces sp. S12]